MVTESPSATQTATTTTVGRIIKMSQQQQQQEQIDAARSHGPSERLATKSSTTSTINQTTNCHHHHHHHQQQQQQTLNSQIKTIAPAFFLFRLRLHFKAPAYLLALGSITLLVLVFLTGGCHLLQPVEGLQTSPTTTTATTATTPTTTTTSNSAAAESQPAATELLNFGDSPLPTSPIKVATDFELPTAASGSSTEFPAPVALDPSEIPNLAAANQTQHKLKPVNFTLVDEIFESFLTEDEVVKRWKQMDSQLQDGMKSILKMVFPQIVSISQDAKVSGDCSGGILKWILSLRNLRSWAIKMLDATGKPTAGVFEGSLTMFGNYRQCLAIRAPDEDEIEITEQFEEYFRGQFCVIHLKPWMPVKQPFYHVNSSIDSLLRKNYKYYEKTLYDELAEIAIAFNFIDIRLDLCVPSTCTVADIQRVAELLSSKLEMRAKVMRCDISPRETNLITQLTDQSSSFIWLLFPLVVLFLTLLATILLACGLGSQKRSSSATNNQHNANSTLKLLLKSLSISGALEDRLRQPAGGDQPSQRKEASENQQQQQQQQQQVSGQRQEEIEEQLTEEDICNQQQVKPLPLYGLRSLFVTWFIIVQMTVELKYQFLRESLVLRNMIISYWPFQIIVNSVLLFDSLILITAFTYSYTCLESTLKNLVRYILDKYIRLIPSIITLVALTIATPLIAIESPVWRNFVEQQATVCKSTGYLNLFFLQNFISYDKICLPHSWLFCVEMQLIILSIPLVLLLNKTFATSSSEESVAVGRDQGGSIDADEQGKEPNCHFRVTLIRMLKSRAGILAILVMLLGFLINFLTVYTKQLPPSWFYTFPDLAQKDYYFGVYLIKTWTHLSVFAVGLLAGHLCRSTLRLRLATGNTKLLVGCANRRSLGGDGEQEQEDHHHHSQAQEKQLEQQHPSPAPSGSSVSQSQVSLSTKHGSALAIMSMELGGASDGSSSDGQSTKSRKAMRRQQALISVSFQLAALLCMSAIIFSTFNWSTKEAPSTIVAAFYDASSRLIWSLALVGLMIQLCLPDQERKKRSKLSSLLSHPLCTFFGRLSFLAYLISPYINIFVLAVEEQSLFPSLFIIFHVIVGNIVITYTLAFILAIVIEQPVRRLCNQFVLAICCK